MMLSQYQPINDAECCPEKVTGKGGDSCSALKLCISTGFVGVRLVAFCPVYVQSTEALACKKQKCSNATSFSTISDHNNPSDKHLQAYLQHFNSTHSDIKNQGQELCPLGRVIHQEDEKIL